MDQVDDRVSTRVAPDTADKQHRKEEDVDIHRFREMHNCHPGGNMKRNGSIRENREHERAH